MYEIKNRIFPELTKTQKTALCNFLRALAKKGVKGVNAGGNAGTDTKVNDILVKFIEDEKYYFNINSPHFEFLRDFIDNEKFISEVRLYLIECKKYYDYKKAQAPLRQAQKEFDKKKRKFLQEVKMSKELPTKKQISYYNSLCKRYNKEKKELSNLSKLDLKNLINEILDAHKTN